LELECSWNPDQERDKIFKNEMSEVHVRPCSVELERIYQIDLAVLSENKQKGTNAEYNENYGFVYSGIDKHKSKGGVAKVVKTIIEEG
jgi:hypothetical protein